MATESAHNFILDSLFRRYTYEFIKIETFESQQFVIVVLGGIIDGFLFNNELT